MGCGGSSEPDWKASEGLVVCHEKGIYKVNLETGSSKSINGEGWNCATAATCTEDDNMMVCHHHGLWSMQLKNTRVKQLSNEGWSCARDAVSLGGNDTLVFHDQGTFHVNGETGQSTFQNDLKGGKAVRVSEKFVLVFNSFGIYRIHLDRVRRYTRINMEGWGWVTAAACVKEYEAMVFHKDGLWQISVLDGAMNKVGTSGWESARAAVPYGDDRVLVLCKLGIYIVGEDGNVEKLPKSGMWEKCRCAVNNKFPLGYPVPEPVPENQSHKGMSFQLVQESSKEWQNLCKMMLVTDPQNLGWGADVKETELYNSIKPVLAWKFTHKTRKMVYDTAKFQVQEDIDQVVPSKDPNGKQPKYPEEIETKFDEVSQEFGVDKTVNGKFLLHGTTPENLFTILRNGVSEKFSGGLFGHGVYLAEDPSKIDQYCTRDEGEGLAPELRSMMYANGTPHPGKVYYALVVRAALGIPVYTKDGKVNTNDSSQGIFANEQMKTELCVMKGSSPPVHHHSLIAEAGSGCKLGRHREFVVFHSNRLRVEYIIAYTRLVDPSLPPPVKHEKPPELIEESEGEKLNGRREPVLVRASMGPHRAMHA